MTTIASATWYAHGTSKNESGEGVRVGRGEGDGEYVKEGSEDVEHADTHRGWSPCTAF